MGFREDEYKSLPNTRRVRKCRVMEVKRAVQDSRNKTAIREALIPGNDFLQHAALCRFWISRYPSELWNCKWKWESCAKIVRFLSGLGKDHLHISHLAQTHFMPSKAFPYQDC